MHTRVHKPKICTLRYMGLEGKEVEEFENEDCPRDCPYFANGEECKADKCVIELINRKEDEADANDN